MGYGPSDETQSWKIVRTSLFEDDLASIYNDMITYVEDVYYADKFYERVLTDIKKLAYLAGTSPNRYVRSKSGTKYYRYNVNKNRHAVFYTLDKKKHACYLWHIMNVHMNFGGRL